jgi:drug/metabolite transporter (DMT)-like permease
MWSGNTIVTKAAAGVISPGSIAFYRWMLAFVVLLPLVGPSVWRQRAIVVRNWRRIAVLGFLGMMIYQSLAYEAARTTTAVNMGVIVALMPLFSALLSSLLAAERLSLARIAGAALSLAGLIYLTSRGRPAALFDGGLHAGDGLMLIAVIANALYGVLLKRWQLPLTLWQQLFCQIGVATVLLLPIWLLGTVSPITPANLPLILYAATAASLVAPVCWMKGIRELGAARTSLFINLLPLMVALFAWLLLDEQIRAYHAIGGALALAGVAIGLRGGRAA